MGDPAGDFIHEWRIRIAAILSLLAYLLLIRLVETRRRGDTSPWMTFFLWLVYQTVDKVGSFAIANLSLDTTGETTAAENEQVMIAFWAPFLLLHLAGPDNVGAYSLDDDKLSWRKLLGSFMKAVGAVYIVYTKILIADKGLLSVASYIMITVGIFRFLEMAATLLLALRKKAWDSSDNKDPPASAEHPVDFSCHGNEGTRRMAQGQWQCCGYRALFDSSVEINSPLLKASMKIFDLEWKEMCEVVEVVASLMYDMLYTKASVVYSKRGYILRLISPLATFSAAVLFYLYPKDSVERPDLVITFMVLVSSFLLDVVWLVAALASTWTYEFLASRPGSWLHHKVLCSGWWCCLRRFALDLLRLVGMDPTRRRMWSETIGRFDLLPDCARTPGCMEHLQSCLETVFGLEDVLNQFRISKCSSQLPPDVKELVFKRIKQRFLGTSEYRPYSRKDIRALWGQEAARRCENKFDGLQLTYFGQEFQEDILLWHIGTSIYLWSSDQQQVISGKDFVKAIQVLSEYLMFLVVLRPQMLPDPALGRLYEVTRQALEEEEGSNDKESSKKHYCAARKQKLANLLRDKERSGKVHKDASRHLISEAARLAIALQEVKPKHVQGILELMFDVWVDKLLYAAIRCSRDSHARQLGRGGELVTIVWIVSEHGGLFRIGEIEDPPSHPHNGGNDSDSAKKNMSAQYVLTSVVRNTTIARKFCFI